MKLTDCIRANTLYCVSDISRLGYEIKKQVGIADIEEQIFNGSYTKTNVFNTLVFAQYTTNHLIRDPKIKDYVLKRDNNTCKCCLKTQTFTDKNGKQYMEAHHLIPIKKTLEFLDDNIKIDDSSNVFCLCPECHRTFHFGDTGTIIKMVNSILLNIDSVDYLKHFKITKRKLIDFYVK